MTQLNGHSCLIVALTLLLVLAAGEVPARVGPYGTGLIELTNYNLATGQFEFLIRVVPDIDVELGELVAFHAVGDRGSPEGRAVL